MDQLILKNNLIYNAETGFFTWKVTRNGRAKAGQVCSGMDAKGYGRISIEGKSYKSHRLVWLYVYGRWPDGVIDHINRKRSDNRLINLRDVTISINSANVNKSSNRSSKYVGVCFHKRIKKWQASIRFDGRSKHLGYYQTEDQAADVALKKRKEMGICKEE